ncbi:MAG: hypothetical protein GAK29_04738 [Acinetobacter bereziniae]|uniref:Uncharacterized protein n=1 Tax=Acinetobacter bereziniae TaxID=106648 RepID=A0A833UII3_ACIBZ|nr:MAG: hypothetical protein GAK29_04738 [Acinetobacter bereziniae]
MKKLGIGFLLFTLSLGAFAQPPCQTAPLVKLKGVDSLTYEKSTRSKLIKKGWSPIPLKGVDKESVFYDSKMPEKYCSATVCISEFKDKKGNTLTITMDDFIKDIEIECKSR